MLGEWRVDVDSFPLTLSLSLRLLKDLCLDRRSVLGEAGQHLAEAPLREWHCPHVGPGTWQQAVLSAPKHLFKVCTYDNL